MVCCGIGIWVRASGKLTCASVLAVLHHLPSFLANRERCFEHKGLTRDAFALPHHLHCLRCFYFILIALLGYVAVSAIAWAAAI